MIQLHTNALHKFTNTKSLLKSRSKSRIQKMMHCLLVYDPVTTLLSISIFIDSTHLKIQFAQNANLMNKTSTIGFANVLQVTP